MYISLRSNSPFQFSPKRLIWILVSKFTFIAFVIFFARKVCTTEVDKIIIIRADKIKIIAKNLLIIFFNFLISLNVLFLQTINSFF